MRNSLTVYKIAAENCINIHVYQTQQRKKKNVSVMATIAETATLMKTSKLNCINCRNDLKHGNAYTTGYRSFAECQGHSAKPQKHSAKGLPSVTLGKRHSVNWLSVNASLPSVFCRALGEDVAEC